MSATDEILAHRIIYMLRDGTDWKATDIAGNLPHTALRGAHKWNERVSSLADAVCVTLDELVDDGRIVRVADGVYREAPPQHTVCVGIHCTDKHCNMCKKWGSAGGDPVCLMFGQVPLEDDFALGSLRCEPCLAAEQVSLKDTGMSLEQLAHKMYVAYGDKAGWQNYQGNPMPTWDDLPENIRSYWRAAAEVTVS